MVQTTGWFLRGSPITVSNCSCQCGQENDFRTGNWLPDRDLTPQQENDSRRGPQFLLRSLTTTTIDWLESLLYSYPKRDLKFPGTIYSYYNKLYFETYESQTILKPRSHSSRKLLIKHCVTLTLANFPDNSVPCTNVSPMIDALGWNSLEHRRFVNRMYMFYKIYKGHIPVCLYQLKCLEIRQLRAVATACAPFHQLGTSNGNTHKFCFHPISMRIWNSLLISVITESLSEFKAVLASILHTIYFICSSIYLSFIILNF